MLKIRNFLAKHKIWIAVIILFLLVRILIMVTFWQASADKGGWSNFYNQAQAAHSVLLIDFHDFCDWHPPLYYFFTSFLIVLFGSQWAVYVVQILLALLSLFLSYKILRLFFGEKISQVAVFLFAVEPYWAWHNWLLVSENLFVPLFLASLYYLLKFTKDSLAKNIFLAAVFLGLATLVRPTTLLLAAGLSLLLLLIFIFKNRLALPVFSGAGFGKILIYLLVFNLIFLAVLSPWVIRNKLVYNRFSLANVMLTNFYFYNLPPLMSLKKGITYSQAQEIIKQKAEKALGANVGDQGNCFLFSQSQLNQQFDFYQTEAKKYIFANFLLYLKVHLVRAVPFFFQPGYFEMWSAYSGEFDKPDLTGLLLKRNFSGIIDFFTRLNLKFAVYLAGVVFWGLCSLAVILSCLYSLVRDKSKFVFFAVSLAIIFYCALLFSPFILARYRLPVEILFLVSLAYIMNVVYNWFKNRA